MWLLSDPKALILVILALLGFSVSLWHALLKNTKENKSKKRFLLRLQAILLALLMLGLYVVENEDKWVEERNKQRAIEHKIEITKQYKSLQENATLVGKWLNYDYDPDHTWKDYYVAIYQREDKRYSIVYYSKKDEIIDIDYEKEKKAPYNPYIYFSDRMFNTENLTLIQGFGTSKNICKRID